MHFSLSSRTQVATAARILLQVPAAAMTAFVAHEADAAQGIASDQLSAHLAEFRALEEQRSKHAAKLSPALAQPARKQELEALCAAEQQRGAAFSAAAAEALAQLRQKHPEQAVLAERRLAAAARQFANMLASIVTPHDLTEAPVGDDSLAELLPMSLAQLQALEAAMEDVAARGAAQSGSDAGRPFQAVQLHLHQADLTSIGLGWRERHSQLLSNQGTGSVAAEFKEPAAARSEEQMLVQHAPVPCAVVQAHGAAVVELQRSCASSMGHALSAVDKAVAGEAPWKQAWAAMLQELAPAGQPFGAATEVLPPANKPPTPGGGKGGSKPGTPAKKSRK